MLNIGLDFDFWNKKIYGSVDAFKEWRSTVLVTRTGVPSSCRALLHKTHTEKLKLKVLKLHSDIV